MSETGNPSGVTCLRRWLRRLAILLIFLFVAGGTGTFFLFKATSKPEFCSTCHYMKPYYLSWKTSTHNGVSCLECHYPPGITHELEGKFQALSQVVKYFTRTYGTKPWAEISDESCLRSGCHEKRLLEGKVVFRNIVFDHKPHLTELRRGKKLRCTSCHSQIVQGTHMTVTEETCYLCHFKGYPPGEALGGCNICHETPTGVVKARGIEFDHSEIAKRGVKCRECHRNVTVGDGSVADERCFQCHGEQERLKHKGDIEFMHDNHVTKRKVECVACHSSIRHTIDRMVAPVEVDCQACHPQHHSLQKQLYMGVGGEGVKPSPNPMYSAQVNCKGCHVSPRKIPGHQEVHEAEEAACLSCHGVQYHGMLTSWKETIKESLVQAEEALKSVSEKISLMEAEKTDIPAEVNAWFKEAKHNIEMVRYGGGVHNVEYSTSLLDVAKEKLKMVSDKLK